MTTPVAAPPPGQTELDTTDSDRAIEHLNQVYRTSLRVSGARDGYRFRHVRADGGLFALDDVRLPLKLGVWQAPLDSLLVVQINSGGMDRECGGVSERFIAGDVFVDAEPGLPATLRLVDVDLQTVMLDLAVLAQVAATSSTRVTGPIRLTGYQPTSPAAASHWRRTVAYLRELLGNEEAAAQPLIKGNAARLLAATVLTTFPNNAVTKPGRQDRQDATGATVRRAVAFMDENAHTDISLADIAAGANVSIRSLQLAFRRQLDTTPMAHLRAVRLDRVHHDLVAADPGCGDTVTEIAMRWGFYSHSRFAARYRHTYGTTPRQTLHNR